MKTLIRTLTVMLAVTGILGCNTSTKSDLVSDHIQNDDIQSNNIEIFYFHYTKRCATCNAVERETKLVLETLYPKMVEEGEIVFKSINLDVPEEKEMAEKLNISGQNLLIIKDGQQVNLTNEGFLNARTNPQKFHDILKMNIDQLL